MYAYVLVVALFLNAFELWTRPAQRESAVKSDHVEDRPCVNRFGAVKPAEEAVRARPNSAEAHHQLAKALRCAGEFSQAIGAYKRAVELKPEYAEAHVGLGRTYLQTLGFPSELERLGLGAAAVRNAAADSFRRAIESRPDLAEAHEGLSDALVRLGRYDEAIRAFVSVIRLKPAYSSAYGSLGEVYLLQAKWARRRVSQINYVNRAMQAFRQMILLDPESAAGHTKLGRAFLQARQYDDAIEAFKTALRSKRDINSNPTVFLRDAFIESGRLLEGIRVFEEMVLSSLTQYSLHYDLGMLYLRVGDKGAAREQYRMLRDSEPMILGRRPLSEDLLKTIEAQGWELLAQTEEFGLYLDPKTLRRNPDGTMRAWVKLVLRNQEKQAREKFVKNTERMQAKNGRYAKYSSTLSLEEYDCKNRKWRVLSISDYDDDGKVIESDSGVGRWNDDPPETVAEASLESICQRRERGIRRDPSRVKSRRAKPAR